MQQGLYYSISEADSDARHRTVGDHAPDPVRWALGLPAYAVDGTRTSRKLKTLIIADISLPIWAISAPQTYHAAIKRYQGRIDAMSLNAYVYIEGKLHKVDGNLQHLCRRITLPPREVDDLTALACEQLGGAAMSYLVVDYHRPLGGAYISSSDQVGHGFSPQDFKRCFGLPINEYFPTDTVSVIRTNGQTPAGVADYRKAYPAARCVNFPGHILLDAPYVIDELSAAECERTGCTHQCVLTREDGETETIFFNAQFVCSLTFQNLIGSSSGFLEDISFFPNLSKLEMLEMDIEDGPLPPPRQLPCLQAVYMRDVDNAAEMLAYICHNSTNLYQLGLSHLALMTPLRATVQCVSIQLANVEMSHHNIQKLVVDNSDLQSLGITSTRERAKYVAIVRQMLRQSLPASLRRLILSARGMSELTGAERTKLAMLASRCDMVAFYAFQCSLSPVFSVCQQMVSDTAVEIHVSYDALNTLKRVRAVDTGTVQPQVVLTGNLSQLLKQSLETGMDSSKAYTVGQAALFPVLGPYQYIEFQKTPLSLVESMIRRSGKVSIVKMGITHPYDARQFELMMFCVSKKPREGNALREVHLNFSQVERHDNPPGLLDCVMVMAVHQARRHCQHITLSAGEVLASSKEIEAWMADKLAALDANGDVDFKIKNEGKWHDIPDAIYAVYRYVVGLHPAHGAEMACSTRVEPRTAGVKLVAQEIFAPVGGAPGVDVHKYRHAVYSNIGEDGRLCASLDLSKMEEINLAENQAWADKHDVHRYEGVTTLSLKANQWTPLPSLSPEERLTHFSNEYLDILYNREQNLYYVKSARTAKIKVQLGVSIPTTACLFRSNRENIARLPPALAEKARRLCRTRGGPAVDLRHSSNWYSTLTRGGGDCQQRTAAWMQEVQDDAKALGCQLRAVESLTHRYAEVALPDDDVVPIDLGGAPEVVEIKAREAPPATRIRPKPSILPTTVVERALPSEAPAHPVGPPPFAAIEETEAGHVLLTLQRASLAEVEQTCLQWALQTSKPAMVIHEPEALLQGRSAVDLGGDGETGRFVAAPASPYYRFVAANPDGMLLVNLDKFTPETFMQYQSLFPPGHKVVFVGSNTHVFTGLFEAQYHVSAAEADRYFSAELDGEEKGEELRVDEVSISSGATDDAHADASAAMGADVADADDTDMMGDGPAAAALDAAAPAPAVSEPEPWIFDFFNSSERLFDLLGRWNIRMDDEGGRVFTWEEGELAKHARSHTPIIFKHPPWHDALFQQFWFRAQKQWPIAMAEPEQGFIFDGHDVNPGWLDASTLKMQVEDGPYEWSDYSGVVNSAEYVSHCPADSYCLNTHTLRDFLQSARYDEASHYLVSELGILADHSPPPPHSRPYPRLSVTITHALDESQWAAFLHMAQKCKVTLDIHLLPDIPYPLGDVDVEMASEPDPWDAEAELPNTSVVLSQNIAATVAKLREQHEIAHEMTLCPHNMRSILAHHQPEDAGHVTRQLSAIWTALSTGKTVILTGEVDAKMSEALAPWLAGYAMIDGKRKSFSGKLVLVTTPESEHHCQSAETVAIDTTAMPEVIAERVHEVVDAMPAVTPPDLSVKARDAFIEKRDKAVLGKLQDEKQSFVVLEGKTGAGKTGYVTQHLADLGHKVIVGEDKLKEWAEKRSASDGSGEVKSDEDGYMEGAESDDGLIILFIDEGNLADRDWLEFKDLDQDPPCIWIEGQPIELTSNHRVIFAANPEEYSDSRKTPALWRRHPECFVTFGELSPAFIYQDVLGPLMPKPSFGGSAAASALPMTTALSEFVVEGYTEDKAGLRSFKEYFTDYLLPIMAELESYQHHAVLVSPRECQMIYLMDRACEDKPFIDIAFDVISSLLNSEQRARFEHWFLEELPKNLIGDRQDEHREWKDQYLSAATGAAVSRDDEPANWQQSMRLLDDVLKVRQHRQTSTEHRKIAGLGGIIIECDNAASQFERLETELSRMGLSAADAEATEPETNVYYHINSAMPISEKRALLEKAFHEGNVVVCDNPSLGVSIERELNRLLLGKDKDNEAAAKSGFALICLQEPARSCPGAYIGPALQRRMVHCKSTKPIELPAVVERPMAPSRPLEQVLRGKTLNGGAGPPAAVPADGGGDCTVM